MEKIIVTEKLIEKAADYVPIAQKEAFVDHCAAKCVQRVDVSLSDRGDGMPYMYMEDTFKTARYLMTGLAVLYLGYDAKKDFQLEDDQWLMDVPTFDAWGASHITNQLERMKGSALRDKVFDILSDYKDLQKKLSVAIRSTLSIMNDPANRIFQKVLEDASDQALELKKKELEDLVKELQQMQDRMKTREGDFDGEGPANI